jgi:hypothetical protein
MPHTLLLLRRRRSYAQKVLALAPASLVAYLPLWAPSGSVAADQSGHGYNGAHTAVTLGQPGIGDGRTAAFYDGSTSFTNWYSAGLAGAFTGPAGTLSAWAKVSAAGVWTDGVLRFVAILGADANNYVRLLKNTTSNSFVASYTAGATLKQVAFTASPTVFFHVAITWDKAADQVKIYYNGVQQGATATALGVWAGSLAATTSVIGAASTAPLTVWNGSIAHVVLWSTALSAAQITQLAVNRG